MLFAEAGWVFMGFILYISGVQGQANSICALKGSSVDLLCSAEHPTLSMKWFTVHWNGSGYVQNQLPANGSHVSPEESPPTLTISNLSESDTKLYCCSETAEEPEHCLERAIQLHVTDLQVKVIPATDGTVTLMCNTSCPLTENPAAYIWYKNGNFLYKDWSPWYQQLVSSEKAVRYSCAIKGYKHLRAPEVSVDSVIPDCFRVIYANGRMCPNRQTSVDEPCTIVFPRAVRVHQISASQVELKCDTRCRHTDPKPAYRWYQYGQVYEQSEDQLIQVSASNDSFSCAVKGFEDLRSDEICVKDQSCWKVNYVSRTLCALQHSSVNISSEYLHPDGQQPKSKSWYKTTIGEEEAENVIEVAGHVGFHDDNMTKHILRIDNLTENDAAVYTFRLEQHDGEWEHSDFSGVTLYVTGLRVMLRPANVTEGQRVTLTCLTSCALPENTTYIWYLNKQLVNKTKQLVLDPVSSENAGNYSCAVKTTKSTEVTLTVRRELTPVSLAAAATVAVATLLVIIVLCVILLIIRGTRTSGGSRRTGATYNMERLNPDPVNENILGQPTEQDDLSYSTVRFSQTQRAPLYSTIQPHQPKEQEDGAYAVINFRPSTTLK